MPGQRKIQAPRRRESPRAAPDGQPRQRMVVLFAAAAAGLVALAIVVGVLAFGRGGGAQDVAAALADAGCTFQSFPAQEGEHTSDFDEQPKWNSYPPTSGRHHQDPAIIGTYDEPINLIQAVHNLEHGVIAVYWGEDAPAEEVENVKDWVAEDPTGMLAAPLPDLADKIALAGWNAEPEGTEEERRGFGRLAKCGRFDEDAFDSFRDAYRFKGPERFAPDQLEPGM